MMHSPEQQRRVAAAAGVCESHQAAQAADAATAEARKRSVDSLTQPGFDNVSLTQPASDKRCRTAIRGIADEFLCPITHELPLDPVTAEDGRVYERSAMEEWLAKKAPGVQVLSPVTNEPMGRNLFAAVQVRNSIRDLVRSGVLDGENMAASWKKVIQNEERVAKFRRLAEAGDSNAMHSLGLWYVKGEAGLAKDYDKAFAWFTRSAEKDNVYGLAACGRAYAEGEGVVEMATQGVLMVARAAEMGSEHSCYMLGWWYQHGLKNLQKGAREALKWYKRMESCKVKDSSENCRETAAGFVREHIGL